MPDTYHTAGHRAGTATQLLREPGQPLLDEFVALPRGILVATAQMLGEGFDDPAINAAVITFRTTSLIQLMQAAGRALRVAPGKDRAHVVQLKDSELAYHYEQRWLYQDISDALRPQLVDITYGTEQELANALEQLLAAHHVRPEVAARILDELKHVRAGDECSLLLTGLPYDLDSSNFDKAATWNALFVSPRERDLFLRVFNDFSARRADVNDQVGFLRNYLAPDPREGSRWQSYIDMLWAMDYARRELLGEAYSGRESRNYVPNRGTTWLIYANFHYHPVVPPTLDAFLTDALNRDEVLTSYLHDPERWDLAAKVPLPLPGTWAFLLDEEQDRWLRKQRDELMSLLKQTPPERGFAALHDWRLSLPETPVPSMMVERFEDFLAEGQYEQHTCPLAERLPPAGADDQALN